MLGAKTDLMLAGDERSATRSRNTDRCEDAGIANPAGLWQQWIAVLTRHGSAPIQTQADNSQTSLLAADQLAEYPWHYQESL
jgi:hypothetical protein